MDKSVHNNKYNYNDVFLRNVIIGLMSFLKDRISIVYTSEEQGEYKHVIPFYYKTRASTMFLLDSFYDDVKDVRVDSNTDIIPRGVFSFETWTYSNDTFTNPTVRYDIPEMLEEELISKNRQIKFVPIEITCEVEFTIETLFEQFTLWQELVTHLYSYSYFTFEHKYITLHAHITNSESTNNVIKFDKNFAHEDRIVMPFSFTIKTHFPIVDMSEIVYSNQTVNWVQNINGQDNVHNNELYDKWKKNK